MKLDVEIKSLDFKSVIELPDEAENAVNGFLKELYDKIDPALEEGNTAKGIVSAITEVTGEGDPVEVIKTLKTQADESDEFRKGMIEDIIRLGGLCELVPADKAEEKREFLKDLSHEKLSQVKAEYIKEVDKKFGTTESLPVNTEDMNVGDKDKTEKPMSTVPQRSYEQM